MALSVGRNRGANDRVNAGLIGCGGKSRGRSGWRFYGDFRPLLEQKGMDAVLRGGHELGNGVAPIHGNEFLSKESILLRPTEFERTGYKNPVAVLGGRGLNFMRSPVYSFTQPAHVLGNLRAVDLCDHLAAFRIPGNHRTALS